MSEVTRGKSKKTYQNESLLQYQMLTYFCPVGEEVLLDDLPLHPGSAPRPVGKVLDLGIPSPVL
jgi:hypothetical protein